MTHSTRCLKLTKNLDCSCPAENGPWCPNCQGPIISLNEVSEDTHEIFPCRHHLYSESLSERDPEEEEREEFTT